MFPQESHEMEVYKGIKEKLYLSVTRLVSSSEESQKEGEYIF